MINVPVEDSGFILEVTVDIDVSHPDQGELTVLLTGPRTGPRSPFTTTPVAGRRTWRATGRPDLTVDGPGSLDDYPGI